MGAGNWSAQDQTLRLSRVKLLDYFFTPKTASFAALATRNLTTVLAGILIFCCVFGLKPVRAFLFCFTSLPKPGKTNSPFFLISLYQPGVKTMLGLLNRPQRERLPCFEAWILVINKVKLATFCSGLKKRRLLSFIEACSFRPRVA